MYELAEEHFYYLIQWVLHSGELRQYVLNTKTDLCKALDDLAFETL